MPHAVHVCALLKRTSPRIYKDQLSAVTGLLGQLCDRPALTATQCRDYLDAYAADPTRFTDAPPADQAPPAPPIRELERYAQITPTAQEVTHGPLH